MNSKSRDIEGFLSKSPLWKSAGLDTRRKTFFKVPFEGSVGEHVPSLMSFRCDHLDVIADTVGIHVPQFLWCPVNTKGI